MVKKIIIFIALALVAGANLSEANAAKKDKKQKVEEPVVVKPMVALTTEDDSLAYCAGTVTTQGLLEFAKQRFGITDAQVPLFIEGFVAGLKKDSTITDMGRAEKFVSEYMQRKVERNKAEQMAWLEENAKNDGVKVLPSGLQYKVLVEGNGPIAKEDQDVTVMYEGKLINGKVFDSSYKRGEPITFKPTGVIKGWTEALTMMPQGSTWELYIPYNLAYGERGAGADIPPYATLIFKVEVREVK